MRISLSRLPAWHEYRVTVYTVLVSLAMTALVLFDAGQRERENVLVSMDSRMKASSELRADVIAEQVDRMKHEVRFLSSIQTVVGMVRAISNHGFDPEDNIPAAVWQKRLETTFSEFAAETPHLSQVRFIGVADNGRELVRIDRRLGRVYVVPPDQLQAKADRPYFQETMRLEAGQVSISEIDLNREHGQIEYPIMPTMRAATPVFGPDGKLFGMIVVNIDVHPLLEKLGENSSLPVYVINDQGDYLLHPDANHAFGFDLGRRWRWQDEYTALNVSPSATPNAVQSVAQNTDHEHHPVLQDFSSPAGGVRVAMRKVVLNAQIPDRSVTIIVALPDTVVAQSVSAARLGALLAMLAASSVASAAAYFYQRQRRRVNEKQAELAAIVESSRDAIIGKTLEGVVTSWNHGAELLFGYSAREAIGRKLANLIVPDELLAQEDDILKRIGRGEVISAFDAVRHRKDGSPLDVSVIVSPIRAEDGMVIGAAKTVRDISEQKAFETQLRELNMSLEQQVAVRTGQIRQLAALQGAVLEHAGFMIIATDTALLITLVNPAAERMLGYRADELIGKQTPRIFHDPAEVAAQAEVLSNTLGEVVMPGPDVFVIKALRGLPNEHEWTFIRKDGSRLPVLLSVTALKDDTGNLLGFLGLAADLTEQREAEKVLETNNRFLDTLTDNIPGLISYWDRDLCLRFANRAFLQWFGKSMPELLGIALRDLMGNRNFSKDIPHIQAVLCGEPQRVERTIPNADGSVMHVWSHYIPNIDHDQVVGFFVLVSDVTDLKHAQLALEDLNQALQARTLEAEAANRAKSEFLANMSHEIRTPMNAILGMLQLLQQTGLNRRQADYASKTKSAAQALLGILNDILDFSKVEAGKLTLDSHPFSIDKLLRDVAVILSASVGDKDVEVLFEIDPNMRDWVIGDAMRLQQVLINLAGNAIKFTERGEVVLSARQMALSNDGISLLFAVRDTGIGISAEQCARIFDSFSQAETSTARRYGGSGLGLTISQRLVQLMGSGLEVDSVVGQGSNFHFTIAFQRATAPEPEKPHDIPALMKLRCLLIDDNASARKVLAEMLASFGWTIDLADSGEAGLNLLQQSEHEPAYDVIFVDWHMPDMGGWETCERIRESQQSRSSDHVSLIMMVTAHSRELLAQRQAQKPDLLDGLLVKPVTASMLFDAVADSRLRDGHLQALEPRPLESQQRLAGLHLLVVDDNPTNQQVARELLSNDGARVQVADGGRAAIAAIKAAAPQFDAVLMDVQMPDMDGYTATREIRTTLGLGDLPIIAVTANAMASDHQHALAAGMNDHVGKPFDLAQLIAVILRHAGRANASADVATDAAAAADALTDAVTDVATSLLRSEEKATDKLPQSEIDSNGALARMGGNSRVYHATLRSFIAGIEPLEARVRQAIAQEQSEELARALHELKGTAGLVGATRLAECAKQAEDAVRSAPAPALGAIEELAALLAAIEPATQAAAQLAT